MESDPTSTDTLGSLPWSRGYPGGKSRASDICPIQLEGTHVSSALGAVSIMEKLAEGIEVSAGAGLFTTMSSSG